MIKTADAGVMWHYNTGVVFSHGITEINLGLVNPIKGNINGNRRNMERSELKKDFTFCCGELSIYVWWISVWTITHRVESSWRSRLKGRCQDQLKLKSSKLIVIKAPFLGVPEAVWSERTAWAGWGVVRRVLAGDRSGWSHIVGGETKREQNSFFESGVFPRCLHGGDNWSLLILNGILITPYLTGFLSHLSCIMIRASSHLERSNLLWQRNNSW